MGKSVVSKDIQGAFTLPSSFYTDQDIFLKLRNEIFLNSWQFAGDTSLLKENNLRPFTLLKGFIDEPLLLTRTEDNKIHCLSNVCTHRGNILTIQPGYQKKLVCGYHGRKFQLNGTFEFMPEFDEAKDFPQECDNLPEVNLAAWNHLLFVNLNNEASFNTIAEILNERIGFLPIKDFKLDVNRSKDYKVKAHWALYCDNYLEGFHIPFVHHDLNTVIDYGHYKTVLYNDCILQIGFSKDGTESFELPEGHPDFGKNVAAYYFWIFPNLMLNFYPWGLSINLVNPMQKDLSQISFLAYIYDDRKIDKSAGALLDQVEYEDEEVVEGVQKGINSLLYNRGRFSPSREQGVHHFHRILSTYL